MSPGIISTAFVLTIVLSAMPRAANGEIYMWIDAAGGKTVSNEPPPKGVRVLEVFHDAVAKPLTSAEMAAVRDATQQAQIQSLTDRIRSLERETQLSSRPPAAPPIQYLPPQMSSPCDPNWSDCGAIWPYPFVTGPVAVIRVPHNGPRFRNFPQMENRHEPHGKWR
jgi:hypothetical protein